MREILSRINEELHEMTPRWKWIKYSLLIFWLILVSRLWYLQIIHGEKLRKYSEINRLKETKIQSSRGLILDRNNNILVDNLLDLALIVTPQYIKNINLLAKNISAIIKIDPHLIIQKIKASKKKSGPFRPVIIKKHLTLNQISLLKHLKQNNNTAINIKETIIRDYPLKKNGAHLFGYLSEITKKQIPKFNKKYKGKLRFKSGDVIGKTGLELIWESTLRGTNGFLFVEVNVHNRKSESTISGLWNFKPKPAVQGKNLILTIDKDLQQKTYHSFLRNDKIGTRYGGAVVMKTNGEILSWVSYPSYNPNIFSMELSTQAWLALANDPNKPLRNKVIQDHYPPGSILKPIVALAALQENFITKDTLIDSPKHITFKRRTYHDYRKTGHGYINITTALEKSANVFFYKLGMRLGIDTIYKYSKLFRLGQKTNIKLNEEVKGVFPNSKWKLKHLGEKWQLGENLVHAIGQGFTMVTPLQMAIVYNAIATSGKIIQPFIVKKITDINNKEIKIFKPKIIDNLDNRISKTHFKTIQNALTQVVHGKHGTAKWWKVKGVKIAGKTGTAQIMSFSKKTIHNKCSKKPREQRHHGWFVAIAPVQNPEITVVVLTEHSCSGSGGSAPIARDIIRSYFAKKSKLQKE